MINKISEKIISGVTDLGVESIKHRINDKLDETKLRKILREFIKKNKIKFDEFDYLDSIDYQGLIDFLTNDLLNLVVSRMASNNIREREQSRNDIASKAIFYSKAQTDYAKQNVSKFVFDCIDIIREFYISKFSQKDFFLKEMIVEEISEKIKSSSNLIVDSVNDLKKILTDNKGDVFSYDNAISMINKMGPDALGEDIRKLFSRISIDHPYFPDFGYDYQNGQVYSKPLTHKAKEMYPKNIRISGKARLNKINEKDIKGDIFDYAYRHQIPITMEITKAIQFLGTKPDPMHAEADKMVGQTVVAFPPAFPPAFPCSIMVGDQVLFEYILLRTQEITDEGVYIVNNNEQGGLFCIEFGFDFKNLKGISFDIHINDTSVKTFLHFVKFISALSKEKMIRVHVLSCGEDLLLGKIDDINYITGFNSIDEEVDFLERICVIEDHFHINMDPFGEITKNEYEMVMSISNLIKQDKVEKRWSEVTITGIVDPVFRDNVLSIGDTVQNLSYIGKQHVMLFGAEFDFMFYKTFENAKIFDLDKISKLLSILDDGDDIKIKMVASDKNSTSIESLSIPQGFLNKI